MKKYIVAISRYTTKTELQYVSHVRKCGIISTNNDKTKARMFSKKAAEEIADKLGRFCVQPFIIPYMEEEE